MATTGGTHRSQPWIKSDEIALDTSSAPWMRVAEAELGKKVHELPTDDVFIKDMRQALAIDSQLRATEEQIANLSKGSLLLGDAQDWRGGKQFKLTDKKLPGAEQVVGKMEAAHLSRRNTEIGKYFQGLKSDPAYDKNGRSYEMAPTYESNGYGQITAWCAAFVNWCLGQADAPRLNYATARSWLDFGTPVAHPVYGCLVIVKPSSSTGNTTGHVGFFVEFQGDRIVLLGGNQGDEVSKKGFRQANVLGYRWPTAINHYAVAGRGVMA